MKKANLRNLTNFSHLKSHFCVKIYVNNLNLFVITVISIHFVRYNHEIIAIKCAKPTNSFCLL